MEHAVAMVGRRGKKCSVVLVYRTTDKGTRWVQSNVCAVWENGEPMRTKPTPTTYTHGDWANQFGLSTEIVMLI